MYTKSSKQFKSGFVTIAGKPNVGKSTILNWFFNTKIAIVSSKPETTRNNIKGILTLEDAQVVFIDTPGIHKAHLRLGKEMVKRAKASLSDTDLVLAVIDATSGIKEDDTRLLDLINKTKTATIILLNKADIVKKSRLLPMIDELSKAYSFLDIIPVSAKRGDNMQVLKNKIVEYLPRQDKYYPDEQLTDQDINFRIAEIIREKALELTRHEVPHSIAVLVEDMHEDGGIIHIKANIYTEKESQKPIIIGHNGSMIKEIGTLARKEIETLLDKKVFLALWVKVLKNWRNDPRALKMLGF